MFESLTAIIIARDAEKTIAKCVEALRFCTRIIVGENNSEDKTAALARAAGAEVRTIVWQGYGKTKNKLIQSVPSGWILSVDSDEVITPELGQEICGLIALPEAADGYAIMRRNYFLGQPIRYCGWSPDWQLRLFRAGLGHFEEKQVHEALRVQGKTGRCKQRMEHYTYPTLEDYFTRLNHYTTLAAQDRQTRGKRFSWPRLLFDPGWTFIKMWILKQGWRDGFPGTALCILSALNTLVKHAKHWEIARQTKR
ncbi:glycosyltransferase family 2 protein [bacterium]|nr:glycosyltransferase family 2 protein [bacterium]